MKPSQLYAATLMSSVGSVFFLTMPSILSAASTHLAIDAIQTGYLASTYFIGFLVLGLLLGRLEQHFSAQAIAFWSFTLLAISMLVGSFVKDYSVMLALVLLMGAGSGALFAGAFSIISKAEEVEHWFGVKVTGEQLLSIVLLFLLPVLASGFADILIVLMVSVLIFTPLAFFLPKKAETGQQQRAFLRNIPKSYLVGLSAITIKFAGLAGLWAFIEQMTGSLGISEQTLSLVIGVSLIGGLLGGFIASFQGGKFERMKPIYAINALLFMVILGYQQELNTISFTALTFSLSFCWNYGMAYELSVVSRVDPSAQYCALMSPAIGVGAIIGPAVAGHLLVGVSQMGLLVTCVLCCAAAVCLFSWVDKQSEANSVEGLTQ